MPIDVPRPRHTPARLAALISGGGTTAVNLIEKINAGELDARLVMVGCSNPKAYERFKARGYDVPVFLFNRKDYADTKQFSREIFEHVRRAEADLVCLAGFLCLLSIPDDYAWRVLNIHPALLPAFGGKGMYGHHVHEAVIKAGCKISGCTVHFADQTYDTGPILVQRSCPVLPDDTPDTLAARVFQQECLAYPEAVNLLIHKPLQIDDRMVRPVKDPA